jgi:hypothetical protein
MQLEAAARRENLIIRRSGSEDTVLPSKIEAWEETGSPAHLVTLYNMAIPDWVVSDTVKEVKVVVELKTPRKLGRFAPIEIDRNCPVHVRNCRAVRDTIIEGSRLSGFGNLEYPLQQICTQAAACATPYAILTDGIDFLFLKVGRKALLPGEESQTQPKQQNDSTLRAQLYVARYCDEAPSVGQCLAFLLHCSAGKNDICTHCHKWKQNRSEHIAQQEA